LSSRAPGARVPRSTADQPPPNTPATRQRSSVSLGPRDRLIGQLHIDGDVLLSGTIEGEIHATGDVEIDDEAKVNASVAGSDVNIRGHVSGPVTARKRLVLSRSGSLTGDVRVSRLVIQDGATFSGNVSMGPQSEASAPPPEPQPAPDVQATPEVQRTPQVEASSSDGKGKPAAGKGKPKR
jgi:cytoskeletal protein CcmA (bactofilin family)